MARLISLLRGRNGCPGASNDGLVGCSLATLDEDFVLPPNVLHL